MENKESGYEIWLKCNAGVYIQDISRGVIPPGKSIESGTQITTPTVDNGIFGNNWPIYNTLLFGNH